MGAELDYVVIDDVPRADLKRIFEDRCDQARHENGHGGYTGTIAEMHGIERFDDRELPSFDEAEAWLDEHHEKWQQALAVSFFDTSDGRRKRWVIGGWCSS